MKTNRALWIVAALSVAALVPLYGDPRRSPVTHSEWARMMMRSLGFEENLQGVENADDIFRTLAWKDQKNFPASKYKRGTGVTKRGAFVDTAQAAGETAYDLPIIRGGDYNVRLKLKGAPDKPFQVEIRKDGQLDSVATHHPTGSGNEYTAVDLGWIRMESGNHTVSVVLPPGTSLESVQVSPPCLSPIEPENGWRAAALTTSDDIARTMLQALELEHELPPADEPIELRAGRFEALAPDTAVKAGVAADAAEIRATPEGLHAIVYADIPTAGLYAVSVWTSEGDGQSWLIDSCRRSDICPTGDPTPKWRTILTSDFNVGRHSFAVLLGNGAMVAKLRLQRLKDSSQDYVSTLKRVGFDVGAPGPITREKAREAMEWLRARWKEKLDATKVCVLETPIGRLNPSGGLAGGLIAGGAGTGTPGTPETPGKPPVEPPPPGPGGPQNPVPPQPSPTPTPGGSPNPTPSITPTPTATPTPTPTPTPGAPTPTPTPTPTPAPAPGGVYGTVFLDLDGDGIQDPNEPGIPNVSVRITDSDGRVTVVVTDSNGAYLLTDVPIGAATVDIVNSTLPPGLSQTAGTDPTTVTVTSGPPTNAGLDGYYPPAIPVATGTLNGVVFLDTNGNGIQDGGESGLPGVSVVVTDALGLTHLVTTDAYGVWAVTNLPPGPATIDVVDATLPPNVTQSAGTDPNTATVVAGQVTFGGYDGYRPQGPSAPQTGSVTGTIFFDADGDGIRDAGEPGMPGVSVIITAADGTTFLVTTDANGNYIATNVPAGNAVVDVVDQTLPPGLTYSCSGCTDPTTVTVVAGTSVSAGLDGYAPATTPGGSTGSVIGRIFFDTNGNGTQDPGEPGLQGVVVEITTATGQLYYATTNGSGDYQATGVPAGTVTVDVVNSTLPAGVTQSAGTDPSTVVVPGSGVGNAGVDGYTLSTAPSTGGLTGTVFLDLNGVNDQEPGENGIPGVTVIITDSNGVAHIVTTDGSGNWTINGLPPGPATVDVVNATLPPGLVSQTSGTDPNTVTVVANTTSPGGNDGYQPSTGVGTGVVSGHLYEDTNGDGVQGGGEPDLAGVSVIITTGTGEVYTVVTDGTGNFSVSGVPLGSATVDVVDSTLPPGYVQTQGTDPTPVTVTPATPPVVNGYEPPTVPASANVTGFVFLDANNNGIFDGGDTGIPGASVVVTAANGQVFVVTTDATGNWIATNVPPGAAVVDIIESTLPPGVTHTAAGSDPSTVIVPPVGTVADPDDGYAPPTVPAGPTGSVQGRVFFDNNGNGVFDGTDTGIPNVSVEVVAANGLIFFAITDAAGNYTVTNVPAGPATVDVVNSTLPGNLTQTAGVDPSTVAVPAGGTGLAGDDGYQPAGAGGPTGTVTGVVFLDLNSNGSQDAGEPGIPGVTVLLTTSTGQVIPGTTDANGVYSMLNAAAGAGTVDVVNATLPPGLSQTAGTDPSAVNVIANSLNDAGFDGYAPASPSTTSGGVTGTVFLDSNGNGVQDPSEPGLSGVQVTITPASGPAIVVVTGSNGVYSAPTVPAGSATVDVNNATLPPGLTQTAGVDPSTINVLPGTINNAGVDGYQPPPPAGTGTVSGTVFFDLTTVGTFTPGEPGIPGVSVVITAANGQTFIVTTDANGFYMAVNVPAGTATVDIVNSTLPPGLTQTAGTDPSTVVVPVAGNGNAGEDGYAPNVGPPSGPLGSVTGVVFLDANGNGTRDANEPGLPGVSVLITAANGQILSVVTGPTGAYTATGVAPGTATVDVVNSTLPPNLVQTAGIDPSTVVVPPGGVGDAGIDGYRPQVIEQPPATPVLPPTAP